MLSTEKRKQAADSVGEGGGELGHAGVATLHREVRDSVLLGDICVDE